MRKYRFAIAALGALVLTANMGHAQTPPTPASPKTQTALAVFPSPNEIVAAAPISDWQTIAASDLLVMELAPDAKGKARRVVIQLMPAPFSQGWIGNIRKLAAAKFWDGTAVVRVQDNYVTQWGDPTEKKALPEGLAVVPESEYQTRVDQAGITSFPIITDAYAPYAGYSHGWPVGHDRKIRQMWPTHCYGMVGVGRNLSPDTGTGAELYTVIGHAPRHLDRNIALVGRIIEGMEHMSSLPRGTGALGFYETPEERTAILSVRMGPEVAGLSVYEYLDPRLFVNYAYARANRRDPFFIRPAGGADICNIPVPVRRKG